MWGEVWKNVLGCEGRGVGKCRRDVERYGGVGKCLRGVGEVSRELQGVWRSVLGTGT